MGCVKTTMTMAIGTLAEDVIGWMLSLFTSPHSTRESGMFV